MDVPVMKKEREQFLDILRGGAAVCIVLYHYTARFDEMIGHKAIWSFNLPWGWMAWSIFFIMTGYLVYPKSKSVSNFIIGKAVRLYPGYWAAMFISFIVSSTYLSEYKVSVLDFVIDLSMLGNYLGVKSVVGVDWFLSVELIFYALIVFVIMLQNKKSFCMTKIIATWSTISFALMLLKGMGIEIRILKIVGILLAAQYAHLFSVGYFLRRIKQKSGNMKSNLMYVFFSLIAHWIAFRSIGFELFYCVIVILFLCFAFDLNLKFTNKTDGITQILARFLIWIAGISYPLYLVHEYLGFAILKYLDEIGLTNEFFIIVPIGISFFIAFTIHKYIEQPISRLYDKK